VQLPGTAGQCPVPEGITTSGMLLFVAIGTAGKVATKWIGIE
jgi:hypothetical protein